MHIHGHINIQALSLGPSQSAQRAAETRKAAANVRKKLGTFADTVDSEAILAIEPDTSGSSNQQEPPAEDTFKHFLSVTA
ncbi:hypothetical protein GCM10011507_31130 [Edaphobacter acidisoli]|uniref:Uncharacterized protein n=1 Tax=Edaphobacter acidisoli TaxID=2040573 RepID=A0A916S018_9BACT|nr:hypothetical protein [Edaphobacter acidisoli]GGA77666.1 hypothetical protein GCM10011507_31130 [Edaphobacter acidisoli]